VLERDGEALPSAATSITDEELAAALLRRDPGATAQLFDRYAPLVQRVLARILGYAEPERADLLHEVFARAIESARELKRRGALRPWLLGIAVFAAQEWLRSRKRRGPVRPPEDGDLRLSPEVSPEAREAVANFYALVERFDEHERSAFILRQLEGMSLQEVADASGVSLSTARRRIERAERRFEELLPEYPALSERGRGARRAL
jgi:RNA polymerase sigma-70 factor (ECF subfamily)